MKSTKTILPHFDSYNNLIIPNGSKVTARRTMRSDGYKDKFVFLFQKATKQLRKVRTLTAYWTYLELANLLATEDRCRNSSMVYVTQSILAQRVGVDASDICRAMQELRKHRLVLGNTRGKILLNPIYIWNGVLTDWQDYIDILIDQGILTSDEINIYINIQEIQELRELQELQNT